MYVFRKCILCGLKWKWEQRATSILCTRMFTIVKITWAENYKIHNEIKRSSVLYVVGRTSICSTQNILKNIFCETMFSTAQRHPKGEDISNYS